MSLVLSKRKLETTTRRRLKKAINNGKVLEFMELHLGEEKREWLLSIKYTVLLNQNKYWSIKCYPLGRIRTSMLYR